MYNFLSRNGLSISFILGFAIVVIFLGTAMSSMGDAVIDGEMFKENGVAMGAAQAEVVLKQTKLFDFGLYATYILLVVAVVTAILLSLAYFFMNVTLNSLKSLLPIIVLAIVFFIAYTTYSPDLSDVYAVKTARNQFGVENGASQLVSGSITVSLFALAATVVSLAATEIYNMFR